MNSVQEIQQMTQILTIVVIFLIIAVIALGVIYAIMLWKKKKRETPQNELSDSNKMKTSSDAKIIAKEYSKQSIFKFMEFDKIEDNMIVQKNGNRYLMVVECQGVNYDLMSMEEKVSVENGFLQFLNTLRHPIQIYVQTRTVNLNNSIANYRKKVDAIGDDLEKMKKSYLEKVQSGKYSKEVLEKELYEVTKQTNLYEYAKDVIQNTERMSLNKNVLNKKYYIIISYYPENTKDTAFDKEEIRNLAFSELYTKAQSIVRTLSACEVGGKILSSNELVELLYVAYNRDESEIYGIDKAMRAGYDELYITAPDVLDKKMRALDEKLEDEALALANLKVLQARSEKQRRVEKVEESFGDIMRKRAEMILKRSEEYIGPKTTKRAIELLNEDTKPKSKESVKEKEKKNTKSKDKENTKEKVKEKGGKKDAKQEEKKTTRRNTTSK